MSTIDTDLPVQGQPYNAAPIRENFGAAAADIDALQSMNAGDSPPSDLVLGELWLDTSPGTTYQLKIWNTRQNLWIEIAALDSLNNLWVPPVGGGLPVSLLADDTTDLGSVPQTVVTITGGGPVYSFGATAPSGIIKVIQFTGATTLIYNATSLILPGAADLTTGAGDMAIVVSLGSGDWQALFFQGATLLPVQGGTGRTTLTVHSVLLGEGTAPVNFAVPATVGYPLLSTGASSDPDFGQLDLTVGVTGVLSVPNGGTGLATITAHDLLIGNDTSAPTLLAPGTIGYPLVSRGSSLDPYYAVLGVPGGGTGYATITIHALLIGNGTSSPTLLTPSATAGVALVSAGASADPAYGPIDLSSNSAVSLTLQTANGGTGLANPAAHGVLVTASSSPLTIVGAPATSGVPLISQAAADPIYGTATVAGGGTGAVTLTNHAVLLGQGTSAVASVGPGTSAYPLISNGAGADPSFQQLNLAGAGITGTLPNGNLPAAISVTSLAANSIATATATFSGSVTTGTLSVTSTSTFNDLALFTRNTENRVIINAPTSTSAWNSYQTALVDRWLAGRNNAIETGADVGSDYNIVRSNDAGTPAGIPFAIRRADGVIILSELPVSAAGLPTGALWNNSGVLSVA